MKRFLVAMLLTSLVVACGGADTATRHTMTRWAEALKLHIATDAVGNYEFPDRLSDIDPLLRVELEPRDSWGNELLYRKWRSDKYDLCSAGPNGKLGDDDDIVVANGKFLAPEEVYSKRPIKK